MAWAGSAESAPTAGAKGHAKAGAVKRHRPYKLRSGMLKPFHRARSRHGGTTGLRLPVPFRHRASGEGETPPSGDAFYDACWQTLTDAYAPMLKRSDIAMDILWPSAGPLVFFGDDLPRAPCLHLRRGRGGDFASRQRPPCHGLGSRTIPSGSFKLTRAGKVLAAPTTLVQLAIQYQDPSPRL